MAIGRRLLMCLSFFVVCTAFAQTSKGQRQRKTVQPVMKFNAGTYKEPNEISVTNGEAIKSALEKKWGVELKADTSFEDFDILYCPEIINRAMNYYYFFSKGYKRFYANADFSTISQRDYDDEIFKNKSNNSFRKEDTYKYTYRVKNDYGYVHYILDRDEYLYDSYLSGGSKYYCTQISIFDYAPDCNIVSRPKTKCAIIQAVTNLLYLKSMLKCQRQGKNYY